MFSKALIISLLCTALTLAIKPVNAATGINHNAPHSVASVVKELKLLPAPFDIGGEDSQFGRSISVSGDWAFVGAPNTAASGRVYVYHFDGSNWLYFDMLKSQANRAGDMFGNAVSVNNNTALVGAVGYDGLFEDSGTVYIFEFNGVKWTESHQLNASDASFRAQMGFSVYLSDNQALVGAVGDFEDEISAGAAYIYDKSGTIWIESQILHASDQVAGDRFGHKVSLVNERIIVAAVGQKTFGFNSGSVYVFEANEGLWVEQQIINAPLSEPADMFGYSLSQSDSVIVIGAPGYDFMAEELGAVFVYENNGSEWVQSQQLFSSDAASYDRFGYAVGISNQEIWVGASGDADFNNFTMAAYQFNFNGVTWLENQVFVESRPFLTQFGASFGFGAHTVMIGAWWDPEIDSKAGSVFVYQKDMGDWTEYDKLLPNDGAAYDHFGETVSIDGDWVMVGAYQDDDLGYQSGAVYAYQFDGEGWLFQQKILAPDGGREDNFGVAVSLVGERVLIGASGTSDAYLFEYINSNWELVQQLGELRSGGGSRFGTAVSLGIDRAVVTSIESGNSVNLGALHVFELDGGSWSQTDSVRPVDIMPGDLFGASVSLSGDRIIVGAPFKESFRGAAYVFDLLGMSWAETIKLEASDASVADFFGYSLALNGNHILVGSFGYDGNSRNVGAAYAFELNKEVWQETQQIFAKDENLFKHFGNALSIENNKLMIGARQDNSNGESSGAAYLYSYINGKWHPTIKFTASDGQEVDRFGWSIGLFDDWVVIGAKYDDDHGTESGSAYLFQFDDDLIFKQNFEVN